MNLSPNASFGKNSKEKRLMDFAFSVIKPSELYAVRSIAQKPALPLIYKTKTLYAKPSSFVI
jgi:hypothetical protein